MATLTGKLISNTYKDLLQVSNGNSGIDTTLRPISDGEGTDSALQISNSEVLTTGKLTVQGDVSSSGKITADSAVIASQVCASTYYGDGSNLTGITASAPTSVASFTANQLTVVSGASFQGKVSGTAIEMSGAVCASTYYGDGSNLTGITASVPTSVSAYTVNQLTVVSGASFLGKVSGTAAEFSGAVSASTYYGDGSNLTNLPTAPSSVSAFTINQLTLVSGGSFLGKVSGTDLEMSGAVSAANIYATTGIFVGGDAVATSADIQAVSALASSNAAAITSINTVVANVSALTSVNAAAITSINSAITSINTVVGNVSVLTSVNAAAITSINTVVANVSALTSVNAAAITSINSVVANVSVLTSVNAAAITSINSAITSINTVVANVSALTSVNAAAITSINTILEGDISADSGTFNTLVVKTSASVSGDLKVGGLIGVGQATPLKQIHITKSALAEINALTDGANIAVDFDAGQNFAVTLAGNRTLDNPTNVDAGQVGSIFIVQDGTGSRTLSYGTSWEFPAGTAPTLSTSINAVDRLDYIVYSSTKIHSVLTKEYS